LLSSGELHQEELINAGVMEAPAAAVFTDDPAWPARLVADQAFIGNIGGCQDLSLRLGAAVSAPGGGLLRNTVARADHVATLPKLELLKRLAPDPSRYRQTAITVGLAAGDESSAGVALNPCIGCGDCATGCNHGAKNSLDCNLLASAVRAGAEIYSGATVLRLGRPHGATRGQGDGHDGWVLIVTHTDATLRTRLARPLCLHTRRVVLAAGSFGSTEILMRSRRGELRFSPKLGQRFSTNGDMLSVVHDVAQRAHCAAGGPAVTPAGATGPIVDPVGPTITGMVDLRGDPQTPLIGGLVIQDLAVPAALRRLFDEAVTTTATLHLLAKGHEKPHRRTDAEACDDPCAVDPKAIDHSLLVAMMWRDPAEGQLTLTGGDAAGSGDGALHVHWPALRDAKALEQAEQRLDTLRKACGPSGRVISNPIWRLLPPELESVMGRARGPLLTVHPLGGCPMGDHAAHGVVDDLGRVFDAAAASPTQTHAGLVVLDGAIVPTSLGINPGLTIAALAQRAVSALLASDVDWAAAPPERVAGVVENPSDRGVLPRPIFRPVAPTPPLPEPTTVQVVERLCGVVHLRGHGPRFVELTLHFEPKTVAALIDVRGPRTLTVRASGAALPSSSGRLRVFSLAKVPDFLLQRFGHETGQPYAVSDGAVLSDGMLDKDADWIGEVSGTLELFRHADRSAFERRWRALAAWLINRGLRDAWQYAAARLAPGAPPAEGPEATLCERWVNAWNLASRAGEVRLLEYALTIDRVTPKCLDAADVKHFEGGGVRGTKRLTYDCASNPWRQLMEVTVEAFPQLDPARRQPRLALDLHYLARQGLPLLRVVTQQDQPAAFADLAAFTLYLLRMLLNVHIWSFRKPDTAPLRGIERLPGAVPGLPAPNIEEIAVGERDGRPIFIRLTRYAQPAGAPVAPNPVLLIHGYSASGTTFAHAAVRPNLAEHLHRRGRDIWIVDLRTSAGMPTATLPWTFEEAARADIPVAIDHIWRATGGRAQLDVVAHCMGAAMLSMALLGERFAGDERLPAEPHWDKRAELPERLRRVVMSQVGPAVMFSPANVLRAFVMRYARHFLGLTRFQFRTGPKPGVANQLLDRLLATMPYPKAEFRLENPLAFWRRTPWTATRHRMDALYGRDFSLANVSPAFLDHIDDHFGPLSLDTVAQTIHFARFNTITDHAGYNAFVSPRQLDQNFGARRLDANSRLRLLCIHGVDNGLADITTLDLMKKMFTDVLGPDAIETLAVDHHGHQDCLVGKGAAEAVFKPIEAFFAGPDR
ncbi:MAG: GMC oxidoreductase, partial [Pseudomonadota bacterium]